MDSPNSGLMAQALAPPESRGWVGIVGNVRHQAPEALFNLGPYELAIVEFDDQGCCYDRRQMRTVAARLDALALAKVDAIVVVFVHGWKHSARSDDDNLLKFQRVLQDAADLEAKRHGPGGPRPVLGIFVAWRGLTFYDRFDVIDNLTFWGRQQAARRVSVGSVRELFGRLRSYRNARGDADGAPLLAIVGHSFGGMIVYSALAQSLIEAATTPVDLIVPRFADLVLLVNPAFEAARYLPIQDLVVDRRRAGKATVQPPLFVCATAVNDLATGLAFPIGNAVSLLTESSRGRQERQALLHTIGHVSFMKTHDLLAGAAEGQYELKSLPPNEPGNPFWVVAAAPAIINGHNGIFQEGFLRFVGDLLFQHMEHTRAMRGKTRPGPPLNPPRP
jgi:pimeloyl-ACP methyl ester carboxylesterase